MAKKSPHDIMNDLGKMAHKKAQPKEAIPEEEANEEKAPPKPKPPGAMKESRAKGPKVPKPA
jgi:hypothetical protein